MRLVEEHDGAALRRSDILEPGQEPFPEPGERSFRRVCGGVDGLLAKVLGDLQEQRGLADLTGTGEQLDAAGSGLGQALGQQIPALEVALAEALARHTRIIIRLWPNIKSRAPSCDLATLRSRPARAEVKILQREIAQVRR